MSSMAALILPFPSATKLPTRARNPPICTLASVPLMENEYVPLRLAFVNPPVAGGGIGLEDPFPPQAAANNASAVATATMSRFTAHLPNSLLYRQASMGSRASCAKPEHDCLFE